MELYIIEDYPDAHPGLHGKALTDTLVLELLAEHGHIPEDAHVRIERLAEGKPVLRFLGGGESDAAGAGSVPAGDSSGGPGAAGGASKGRPVAFSVSHTGRIFACAVNDPGSGEIGLDIQTADRGRRTQRIAERYFTPAEQAMIKAGGNDSFFRIWTRKEAYAKYTGEGLAVILEGVPVLGREDVVFTDLNLGDGLYGCICCGRRE